jgi:hypothetical protein
MPEEALSRRIIVTTILWFIPFAAVAQYSTPDSLHGLLDQVPNAPARGAASRSAGSGLTQDQIGLGLKDALKVASQRVIGRVGKTDGYNGDPEIRIPLPGPLQQVEGPLRSVGASGMLDDLRLKMNRGGRASGPQGVEYLRGCHNKNDIRRCPSDSQRPSGFGNTIFQANYVAIVDQIVPPDCGHGSVGCRRGRCAQRRSDKS